MVFGLGSQSRYITQPRDVGRDRYPCDICHNYEAYKSYLLDNLQDERDELARALQGRQYMIQRPNPERQRPVSRRRLKQLHSECNDQIYERVIMGNAKKKIGALVIFATTIAAAFAIVITQGSYYPLTQPRSVSTMEALKMNPRTR